jgi:hypothetical protein
MFGMLDYRAHRLFQVLTLPYRVAGKLGLYAIVFASIMIAERT